MPSHSVAFAVDDTEAASVACHAAECCAQAGRRSFPRLTSALAACRLPEAFVLCTSGRKTTTQFPELLGLCEGHRPDMASINQQPAGRPDSGLSFIPVAWLIIVMALSAYGLISSWRLIGDFNLPESVLFLIYGGLTGGVVTILWGLYLLGLAFNRSARFPRHYTIGQVAIILWLVVRQAYTLLVPDFVFSAEGLGFTVAEIAIGLLCIYLLRRGAGAAPQEVDAEQADGDLGHREAQPFGREDEIGDKKRVGLTHDEPKDDGDLPDRIVTRETRRPVEGEAEQVKSPQNGHDAAGQPAVDQEEHAFRQIEVADQPPARDQAIGRKRHHDDQPRHRDEGEPAVGPARGLLVDRCHVRTMPLAKPKQFRELRRGFPSGSAQNKRLRESTGGQSRSQARETPPAGLCTAFGCMAGHRGSFRVIHGKSHGMTWHSLSDRLDEPRACFA